MHFHIPIRITINQDALEYQGLGQCHCGLVAYLHAWALRPWLRQTDPDNSHGLFWHLAEDWRDADETEQSLLADSNNNILLKPKDFSSN